MTRTAVADMIGAIGLPYAYDHFDEDTSLPYICFLYPDADGLNADNTVYATVTSLVVELYADAIDFDLEDRVASALNAAELPFTKSGPSWLSSEKMYQTTYTTEVLLTDV